MARREKSGGGCLSLYAFVHTPDHPRSISSARLLSGASGTMPSPPPRNASAGISTGAPPVPQAVHWGLVGKLPLKRTSQVGDVGLLTQKHDHGPDQQVMTVVQ